jgi:hypothetical protein
LAAPWAKIRELAGINKNFVVYSLRHSSIVRGLRAGLPVELVGKLHDTSAVMISKHYAAYIIDAMDEVTARAVIPLTSPAVSPLSPAKAARQ